MPTTAQIVVVEDESDLAELVAYNLKRAGHSAQVFNDGLTAVEFITKHPPHLIVLDLMLPRLAGTEVARQIRTNPRTATVPILMVTARAAEIDQVAGFKVGADDYVTKPFSMQVLLARVDALLRRARAGTEVAKPVEVGPLAADLAMHQVTVGGKPMTLTLTEFRLLVALMRGRGQVLSRDDLVYTAMGPSVMVTARTIDVHIAAIRKKLGDHQAMIRTIRGVGYSLREVGSSKAAGR